MAYTWCADSWLNLIGWGGGWLQEVLLALAGASGERVVLRFWQSVGDQAKVSGAPDG